MRILIAGKYPPTQGGTAKNTFWLARGLALRGHTVTVVSNALAVEDEYRAVLSETDNEILMGAGFGQEASVQYKFKSFDRASQVVDFIPSLRPNLETLIDLLISEVRETKPDVIVSMYLQPFAIAADYVSQSYRIPHVLTHAGSDIFYLAKQPGFTHVLSDVFRRADVVMTVPPAVAAFLSAGVDPKKIVRMPGPAVPWSLFSPEGEELDFSALIHLVRQQRPDWPEQPPLPAKRPIGIFGKVSETKGSFALIDALSLLERRGICVPLAMLAAGPESTSCYQSIRDNNLADQTVFLPPIPHWQIPKFIRSCRAVCFLEHRFWLDAHSPSVPLEILACGRALVISAEAAGKKPWSDILVSGQNCLIVADPTNVLELAGAIEAVSDERYCAQLGEAGSLAVPVEWRRADPASYLAQQAAKVAQHPTPRRTSPVGFSVVRM
jgi:glycosyltransferase involved in cell wall biosynthesis